MRHRIRRVEPLQVAKVMAVLYGLASVLFVPVFLFMPSPFGNRTLIAIAVPVVYAVLAFVVTFLGAVVYNLVAGWVGGIEVELEPPPGA